MRYGEDIKRGELVQLRSFEFFRYHIDSFSITSKMKLRNLLCHPIDTFIAFKEEIRHRSPRGKWDFVRNTARGFLFWIGIHIVDEKFKVNLLAILPGLVMLDYFVLLLYTFYVYKDDVMRALQPLCLVGMGAPVRVVNKLTNLFLLMKLAFRLIRV